LTWLGPTPRPWNISIGSPGSTVPIGIGGGGGNAGQTVTLSSNLTLPVVGQSTGQGGWSNLAIGNINKTFNPASFVYFDIYICDVIIML